MTSTLEELDALYRASTQGPMTVACEDVYSPDDLYVPRGHNQRNLFAQTRNKHNAAWIAAMHNKWEEVRDEMAKRVEAERALDATKSGLHWGIVPPSYAYELNRAERWGIVPPYTAAIHAAHLASSRADLAAMTARAEAADVALTKINEIRKSIVGMQGFNFSEHAYPLVAALDAAGYDGGTYEINRDNLGTLIERATKAEASLIEEMAKRVEAEHALAATKAGRLYSDLKVARLKDALEGACKDIIEADLTVWAEAAERDPSRVPAAQPANAEVERRLSELDATKAGLLSLHQSHAYSRQIKEEEEAKERQAREAEERQAREAEERERCRLASELEASRAEVEWLRRGIRTADAQVEWLRRGIRDADAHQFSAAACLALTDMAKP